MSEILTVPNNILRQKSKPIKDIDFVIKSIAQQLVELMGKRHNGLVPIAISAPQIGEFVRMFVYRANPYSETDVDTLVINPELIYAKGEVILPESCLSIPNCVFYIKRHKIVKIRGLTINGESRSFKGRGVIAQALEHELNHLDGILIDSLGGNNVRDKG